jgi:dTDP-glucose 4,6-dehydratase
MNLLNAAKTTWQGNYEGKRFYHISTDEVYGSLGPKGCLPRQQLTIPILVFRLKASSDHFVHAYGETYGLPYVLNCSNNYGPFHFPEKLIPLFINNIIQNKALPVYGDGKYTRIGCLWKIMPLPLIWFHEG